MKVSELIAVLQKAPQHLEVLIRLDGSIYPTAPVEETEDYNIGMLDPLVDDFYIVADPDFPEPEGETNEDLN